MSLQDQFADELKMAMKAQEMDRVGAVRILIGEFQRQREKTLSDEEVIGIIKKLIKSERELLAVAGKETSKFLVIMEEYLPRQASEEEVRAWIEENIDFSMFKNKMQAIGPVMRKFGLTVDGNTVKKIVQSYE